MVRRNEKILLDGRSLTLSQLYKIVYTDTQKVGLKKTAYTAIRKSKILLERKAKDTVIYGVTTGFGPMASHIIGKDQTVQLQYNLIRSHATGMGEPIASEHALAAMVVRLNTLAGGYSGISVDLVNKLTLFINKRIIPVIPEHGAVGTSGDLVQLAHIAQALIGEGEVFYQGKRQKTASVLRRLKISPHRLEKKEGLSLINGTAVMTGIAGLLAVEAEHLLNTALRSSALSLELVRGVDDMLSKELHNLRPHHGQKHIAAELRTLVKSSKLLRTRESIEKIVGIGENVCVTDQEIQNVYSFRCIPQILGPIFDTLEKVKKEIVIEMNSVTDNPIICPKTEQFLHGGNFHGDYIATAMDQLKAGLVKFTLLSERRINFFLNENVNKIFPPFLNLAEPGLTLALQGLQFVATSTTAQSQSLAYPHSLHSISTNADNQDVVSMGTDAALMTDKVLDNAFTVFTIELIVLSQAASCLGTYSGLSKSSRALITQIRETVPVVIDDRSLARETTQLTQVLREIIL